MITTGTASEPARRKPPRDGLHPSLSATLIKSVTCRRSTRRSHTQFGMWGSPDRRQGQCRPRRECAACDGGTSLAGAAVAPVHQSVSTPAIFELMWSCWPSMHLAYTLSRTSTL